MISLTERNIYLGWAAESFLCLREHAPFRTLVQDRLTAHFDNAGGYFLTDANCPDCRAKTAWTQAEIPSGLPDKVR